MLEDLNQIDWNALNVPEMPDWIRGLASTDTDTRKAAYDSIYFDSGVMTPSEITPLIVPFIIELLQQDTTPRKHALLMMLVVIAHETIPQNPDNYSALAQRTFDEIARGVDVYLSFRDDPETQMNVFKLFLYLRPLAPVIAPRLLEQLATETNPEVKAETISIIDHLVTDNETIATAQPYVERFSDLLSFATDDTVQLDAAIALTRLMKSRTRVEAEELVVQALRRIVLSGERVPSVDRLSSAIVLLGTDRALNAHLSVFPQVTDEYDIHETIIPCC